MKKEMINFRGAAKWLEIDRSQADPDFFGRPADTGTLKAVLFGTPKHEETFAKYSDGEPTFVLDNLSEVWHDILESERGDGEMKQIGEKFYSTLRGQWFLTTGEFRAPKHGEHYLLEENGAQDILMSGAPGHTCHHKILMPVPKEGGEPVWDDVYGKWFVKTGEVRSPKKGEYFLYSEGNPVMAVEDFYDFNKVEIMVPFEPTTTPQTSAQPVPVWDNMYQKWFRPTGERRTAKPGEYYWNSESKQVVERVVSIDMPVDIWVPTAAPTSEPKSQEYPPIWSLSEVTPQKPAVQTKRVPATLPTEHTSYSFKHTGTTTTCQVTYSGVGPDNQFTMVSTGTAVLSPTDTYDEYFGKKLAFRRAVKVLPYHVRHSLWQQFYEKTGGERWANEI